MLKAMMIITMVSGATYEVKLPTMEQCMAQRSPVESQSDVTSAACIPRSEQSNSFDKMKVMMNMFKQLVRDLEADQNKKCGPWDELERDGFHWAPSELCGQ